MAKQIVKVLKSTGNRCCDQCGNMAFCFHVPKRGNLCKACIEQHGDKLIPADLSAITKPLPRRGTR